MLYHDKDYRVALVGHPNREYLWLLSRTPAVTDQLREQLLTIAREQGYDTSNLIWRQAE
ncbi:Outer membrane lipoprotein Blc precursor [compost metagenome]